MRDSSYLLTNFSTDRCNVKRVICNIIIICTVSRVSQNESKLELYKHWKNYFGFCQDSLGEADFLNCVKNLHLLEVHAWPREYGRDTTKSGLRKFREFIWIFNKTNNPNLTLFPCLMQSEEVVIASDIFPFHKFFQILHFVRPTMNGHKSCS